MSEMLFATSDEKRVDEMIEEVTGIGGQRSDRINRRDGMTRMVRAVEYCRTTPTTVLAAAERFRLDRRALGAELRRQGVTPLKPQAVRDARIVFLYQRGWSGGQLAEHFGLHKTTIYQVLERDGIPRRERLDHEETKSAKETAEQKGSS